MIMGQNCKVKRCSGMHSRAFILGAFAKLRKATNMLMYVLVVFIITV